MISYQKLLICFFYAFIISLPFILGAMYFADQWVDVLLMTLYSTIYFSLFCLLAFLFGKKTTYSKDINAMNKLILILVLVKLITSLALVFGFMMIHEPADRWFVVPFLATYVTFTFVEVISLRSLLKSS